MLGGDSYYEVGMSLWYERYMIESSGTVSVENIHELCEKMYQYLLILDL